MRTQNICFPDQQVPGVFPRERSDLPQALSELHLQGSYPVIVLIGGEIEKQQEDMTRRAIHIISGIAEENKALVICGGTDMGIMAEIGQARWKNGHTFPLLGVAPEELVTWPRGPKGFKFLSWGSKRWQLERHYSHFILVPGNQFGDESPWIVDAATILSNGYWSVTILVNGGEVSRKDIELSLENSRPVIALGGTGRLANELAIDSDRHPLITVVPVHAEQKILEIIQSAISPTGKGMYLDPSVKRYPAQIETQVETP